MRRSYHYEETRGIDQLEHLYGRFLGLPPAVVLSVLWLVGLTLVVAFVLMFYLCALLAAA